MRPRINPPEWTEVEPITAWLRAARSGSEPALGRLLNGCREYLLLVANQELRRELRPKLGASDIVQETFLEAQRDFANFDGRTRGDLLVWLRAILLNNLRDAERRYLTAGRDVTREVSLEMRGDSPCATRELSRCTETPSWLARLGERDDRVRGALAALPDDYRDVIELRNLSLLSFVEIGRRMGRSPDAVRKLWARAIEALQDRLEERDER